MGGPSSGEIVGWEYNQPFEALMTRHGKPALMVAPEVAGDPVSSDAGPARPTNEEALVD